MTESIFRIDLNGVNCYLLKGENGFILVDTGGHLIMDKTFTNRLDLLLSGLEAAQCTEHNINLIILTHGDNDHVCNAMHLREKYRTKIAVHKDDLLLVEKPTLYETMKSFNYSSFAFRLVFKLLRKTIENVMKKTIDEYENFSPDILLTDGFELSAYGIDAKVIHLPGHTDGSIAVLTKSGDLIAGDTFINIKKPALAPNAVNYKQLSFSVEKLKKYPIKTVYPGHGNPFELNKLKL